METQQLFRLLFTNNSSDLSIPQISFGLLLPFFLSVPIALVYRRTQNSQNYSIALVHAICLFAMIASAMTMVIGDNIARAFGLVGAMSIVRFRNALKSPMDAVYIFWSLSIGVCCGVGHYGLATMSVLLVGGVALMLHRLDFGYTTLHEQLVRIEIETPNESEVVARLEGYFVKKRISYHLVNILTSSAQSSKTYVYLLRTKNESTKKTLHNDLTAITGVRACESTNPSPLAFAA